MPQTARSFYLKPTQYQLFRFQVTRPTTLQVRLIATAPVNLFLLDSDDKVSYEKGTAAKHTYTAAWGRKSDLEATVKVEPGSWYLVVEGSTEESKGRVEVFQ